MAIGDAAAAAGLWVEPSTADVRQGYEAVNRRGDELAEHMANGGHDWSKITGKPALAAASHSHDASTIASGGLGFTTNVDAAISTLAGRIDQRATTTQLAAKRDVTDGQFGQTPIYTPHGRSTQVTTSYVAAYINSDGRLGASPSSRRYKDNITDLAVEVEDVLSLRPVEFDRIGGGHEIGLIAEEAVEHVPAIVVRSLDGQDVDGVHYHLLPVLLLRVVQEQQAQIAALAARIDELEAR